VKTFSDRLKYARQLRGLTQQQLARMVGVSQSAIGSYESGQRRSTRALFKLAAALNVEAIWLNSGKGPMEAWESDDYRLREPAATLGSPDRHSGRSRPAPACWPFPNIEPTRYEGLVIQDKRTLEKLAYTFIEACHLEYGSAKSKSRRNN
jgi:transcriptional regulator with XRE-family HTH domain